MINNCMFKSWLEEKVKQDSNVPAVFTEVRLPSPVCPKCGGKMELKDITRGPNAGRKFWGCSNFLTMGCKGTRGYNPEKQLNLILGEPQSNEWYYARTIRGVGGVSGGVEVAVQKKEGKWYFVTLEKPIIRGEIPNEDVVKFLRTFRDLEKRPYKTYTPSMSDLISQIQNNPPGD
jgi:hypothetical protein